MRMQQRFFGISAGVLLVALAAWTPTAPAGMLGDMNCDGVMTFDDIDPFILALSGETAYHATYPDCDWLNGDLSGDGMVTFDDIDGFMSALLAGGMSRLALAFGGLEDLGPDYVYEGWVIVDGAPVSTGTFVIDETGQPNPAEFLVAYEDAAAAALFVLTIEPADDPDPAPAATHVLAGPFSNGVAPLDVGHPAAIGDDFTSAAGYFVLNTPSTGDIASDYHQGIWWLDPMGGPGPSLTLPTLPAGWAYEGWVVGDDGPISTGRFLTASGADSDGAGPDAGPDAAPPFPGQDFIDPPQSLIGYAAVISVEPEPDNSAAPFAIKPLVDMSIEDVTPPATQAMGNNAGSAPVGTAVFHNQ